MKKIIIYSTPTCPWCMKAKEWMKKNKIEFIDHDVSKDEKARHEMLEKSGQLGVPVIDIEGTIIIGFDEEKLKKLTGEK